MWGTRHTWLGQGFRLKEPILNARGTWLGQSLTSTLPRAEQAAEEYQLPRVIAVVIGSQQHFAQKRVLFVAPGNLRIQVAVRILDQLFKGCQVFLECSH